MVSRATKRIWQSVALGLALSPTIGTVGLARGQTPTTAPAAAAGMPAPPAAAANDIETCRQLIRDGRAALAAGDKVKAERLAHQAAAMKVSLPYWEKDTPEKLLVDIGVKTTTPPAGVAAASGSPAPTAKKADPHLLVKQGQDALKAGKLDDAQKLAQQAKMVPGIKWGMFEESPEKLLDEVQKARTANNKVEADRMLVEGRKLYEQGKYDLAEKSAYKAGSLHGPYGVWDFGDKPEKLLADIRTARDKARKASVPAPSAATSAPANAKSAPAKPAAQVTPTAAVKQTSAPAPTWPSEVKTADVKGPDLGPGVVNAAAVVSAAGTPAVSQASTPMPANSAPPNALPPMPVPVSPMPANPAPTPTAGPTMPLPPSTPVAVAPQSVPMPTAPAQFNPARMQAMQCMKEGKEHQDAGRYVEARQKYQEARSCGVEFGPTDESPDRCIMDLAAVVAKQIDGALRDASPAAETKLNQARALAIGFALDTRAIDAQLAAIKNIPATPKVAANDPRAMGTELLDKARLELRRGQCETARQIATEVHNGPYAMQAEAVVLLRSIDVEEHNQRVLAANRNYDAGLVAFRSKDYGQAAVILQQVDPSLLAADRVGNLKQVMDECVAKTTVAQTTTVPVPPPPPGGILPVAAPPQSRDTGVTNAASTGVAGLTGPMPKMTAPAEGDSLAAQVQAMQNIEYQQLRQEGLDVQTKSRQMFERGETDAALDCCEAYLKKVKAVKLDQASMARLQKPIEAKLSSYKLLKSQKDDSTRIASSKSKFEQERKDEFTAEQKRQQQVKELMKQYNALYKEGKYDDALLAAQKAHELDRDDPTIDAAVQVCMQRKGLTTYEDSRKLRENMVLNALNQAESPGPYVDSDRPVAINKEVLKFANKRGVDKNGININTMRSQSAKELEIQSKLNRPIQVDFHNVPLRQAVDDIRAMTKMNVHLESESLAAEAVNPETPITLKGDLSLKCALKVMLDQAHLTYVIQDEMLKITTPRGARGKQVQRVFSVADLVIPIDDYILPDHQNINKTMQRDMESSRINMTGGSPTNRPNMLPNGQQVGSGSGGNSMSTTGGNEMRNTSIQPGSSGSTMSHVAAVAPTKQTMQDMLIKLITGSVAPETWAEAGGSGTIDYMPIGMALVINQTPDVQEQVADLLDALRRLQDLEVAVEVRVITLAETFFERIGLDFALNVTPNKNTQKYEPQLVTGQFAPAGQINSFMPQNFLSGITGINNGTPNSGSFTSDLGIPIRSSSFQYAIPPFAYPNNPGFDGGLSMGLAFLSDIQVYMFMEAAQGDRRTNVMSAPKLTLFNGQTATITVSDNQYFVTNVNVVGFGGQIVFVPVNSPTPLGVSLTIQAVVSADRRFVRLNLTPQVTNLASAIVPLFPVTTFITPVFEGGAQGQPIPFTQFIQQPSVAQVSIQTTVSIPDGGTVILGGMKTLSEGRNEFGPPVLSKIPYVDRLFKNVGYGRESQSLLLMVTPRIIINSEEEERQTGVNLTPPQQP
jgi:type II secretory pathway component GspD/PulD (secretin)/tetratricopeptide (TPR) repeat protein